MDPGQGGTIGLVEERSRERAWVGGDHEHGGEGEAMAWGPQGDNLGGEGGKGRP